MRELHTLSKFQKKNDEMEEFKMNEKVTQLIGRVKLGAKKNAPELLLAGALITGTATIITASRATLKARDLKVTLDKDNESLNDLLEANQITDESAKLAIRKTYSKYALDLVKTYAIPTGLYVATIGMIFTSYKIQKDRQLALSAALGACTAAYTSLVNKLKNGAAYGLTAKEVMEGIQAREVVDSETGEVIIEKYQVEAVDTSCYKVRFDRYATAWEKDKFQNECTLRSEENWANDKLRLQGYLFLNDVFERLGLPKTKTGQIVGWVYEGYGDGFIDFGVTDCSNYEDVTYDSNAFDLNFNVDGDILTDF